MNIEQAINYLKSSGMSDEQIIEVADGLTKGAISQLRAEIESLENGIASYHNDRPWIFKDEVLEIIDKYAESEE